MPRAKARLLMARAAGVRVIVMRAPSATAIVKDDYAICIGAIYIGDHRAAGKAARITEREDARCRRGSCLC